MTVADLFRSGLEHHRAGQLREAETLYRQALATDPGHSDSLHLLGVIAHQGGRHETAIGYIKEAIERRPGAAPYHFNLGHAFSGLGRGAEAEAAYREAVDLAPEFAEAHIALGSALVMQDRYEEAIAACREALRLEPGHRGAFGPLGTALLTLGRFAEAETLSRSALAANPGNAAAHVYLASALTALGRIEAAETACRDALRLRPDDVKAHLNLSHVLLLSGQFEEGWREFEWRWRAIDVPARRFAQPEWKGESLAGRTILLYGEQGLGDTIQFSRFVPQVAALGGRVLLATPLSLTRLLKTLPGDATVLDRDAKAPAFDVHASLLSLPLRLGVVPDGLPGRVPYLEANPTAVARWRRRMEALSGLRVGLVWSGNPKRGTGADHARSIPLDQFAPLVDLPGVNFVSLQKGEAAHALRPEGMALHDWTDELNDFADTAALVAALDLVISVDTSVVHLAGALGRPVWMLNRFDTCWRWQLGRDDSPWYPTLRQFRQPVPRDWASVLKAVCVALANLGHASKAIP
jgi:Flp pilus assembly protein TadD